MIYLSKNMGTNNALYLKPVFRKNSNNKPEQKIARLSALLDKKELPQADFQDFTIDEEIFKILSTPADQRSPEDRQKLMDYNKKQLDRQKLENEIKRVEEELAKDSNNEELKKYLKWLKGLKGEYFDDKDSKRQKQKLVAANVNDIGLYKEDVPSKEHGIILVLKNDKNEIIGELERVVSENRDGDLQLLYYFQEMETGTKHDLQCEALLQNLKLNPSIKESKPTFTGDFQMPKEINESYGGIGEMVFKDAVLYMDKAILHAQKEKDQKIDPKIAPTNVRSKEGLKYIKALWVRDEEADTDALYKDYGGLSLNLKKFEDYYYSKDIKKMSQKELETHQKEAAKKTITGTWAADLNYKTVADIKVDTFPDGQISHVTAFFEK
jgi:hypothetical protein